MEEIVRSLFFWLGIIFVLGGFFLLNLHIHRQNSLNDDIKNRLYKLVPSDPRAIENIEKIIKDVMMFVVGVILFILSF